jgi:hypothetical protein
MFIRPVRVLPYFFLAFAFFTAGFFFIALFILRTGIVISLLSGLTNTLGCLDKTSMLVNSGLLWPNLSVLRKFD